MREQRNSKLPNDLAEIERIRYFNPKKYVEYNPRAYQSDFDTELRYTAHERKERYVE